MNTTTTTYIALLRGINVGGHSVTMARLRDLFAALGFARVRSYIQTGNVFFESAEANPRVLRATIEGHLRAALGYPVPTCVRTVAELERVLARDPFRGIAVTPDVRLSVAFLAEPAAVALPTPDRTPDGAFEVIDATRTEVFVVWRLQGGRPGTSYHLRSFGETGNKVR